MAQLVADKKVQELTISRKNTLNYVFVVSGISILLILQLYYRNYKQKHKLQQQRITKLETEKQLTATAAVLKRGRIGKNPPGKRTS